MIIALLLLSNRATATEQPASEAWYVYVDNQTKYAAEHVVKRTLANGDIECRVDSKLLLNLLGNRQEVVTDAVYVSTSDLRPVSAAVHSTRASGEIKFSCEKVGENLQIRRDANGLTRSASIDLKQNPIFRAMLSKAILQFATGTHKSETDLAVIDEESLQ